MVAVEHQQHLVRRARQRLAHHALHLLQLLHQRRLGVEPARGVGDAPTSAPSSRALLHRVEDHRARVRRRPRPCTSSAPGAVGPDVELLGGGGAEGVSGGEHHLLALAR